eukprot:m.43509 g.43509  ORF g.43509 m.43509 type:complete len:110 (-) comp12225_c0_seq1:44-373(-)
MLLFCPVCGNTLALSDMPVRFACITCPYTHRLDADHPVRTRQLPVKVKKMDDVLGGEQEWQNAEKTEADCPKCHHSEAYFTQIQIRSADEPMTIFYKCANMACGHRWRD